MLSGVKNIVAQYYLGLTGEGIMIVMTESVIDLM